MKSKGREMESICSSLSKALTNEIESTCSSSHSESICCSSNRIHIKRRRFHMAKKKTNFCERVQKLLGDDTPDPMFKACDANRDAFIKLLQSACDGTDNTMGSPDMPEIFWEKFTKRWVQDLKLDIVITEKTVATCERFGSYLKDLHLRMEKTKRAFEKLRSEQYCQPLELKQSLFKIFGTRKPRFRRKTSTGSSSKSSRSGKSSRSRNSAMSIDASRLSDARGPIDVNDDWNEWEPRLFDALAPLHSVNLVTVAEVDLVSAQFRRSTTRIGLRLFLGKQSPADQVQYIRDMLANPPVT